MVTFFTIPKPFRGHIAKIQINALGSWAQLCPPCEVIVLGDEEGSAEAARGLGLRHIPDVERNQNGTPLVRSVFEVGQQAAERDLVCYVNADIILMRDFLDTVRRTAERMERFLMVGQRWDVEFRTAIDFTHGGWEDRLRKHVEQHGRLHEPTGIDYFAFQRGTIRDLPPFAVGRTVWDNWLIFWARRQGMPVVDATRAVMAVHQNHDYGHRPSGQREVLLGPEAKANWALAGGGLFLFNIKDATHRCTALGPRLDLRWGSIGRRVLRLPLVGMRSKWVELPLKLLAAVSRPARLRIYQAVRRRRKEGSP